MVRKDKTLSTSGRLKVYIHEGRNIGIYFLPETCDITLGCYVKVTVGIHKYYFLVQ